MLFPIGFALPVVGRKATIGFVPTKPLMERTSPLAICAGKMEDTSLHWETLWLLNVSWASIRIKQIPVLT